MFAFSALAVFVIVFQIVELEHALDFIHLQFRQKYTLSLISKRKVSFVEIKLPDLKCSISTSLSFLYLAFFSMKRGILFCNHSSWFAFPNLCKKQNRDNNSSNFKGIIKIFVS